MSIVLTLGRQERLVDLWGGGRLCRRARKRMNGKGNMRQCIKGYVKNGMNTRNTNMNSPVDVFILRIMI